MWKRPKKTKPALWLSVRGALPVRAPERKAKVTKPRQRLRHVSAKQSARKRQYNKQRESFLEQFPRCAVFIARCGGWELARNPTPENVRALALIIEAAPPATTIHHSRGKIGSLLFDERYWIPASLSEHIWIDANREYARRLGVLARLGKWNETSP